MNLRTSVLYVLRWTAAFLIAVAGVTTTSAAHAQLTTGCADGQREGYLTAPSIAGCSGAWSVPGIAAGATATFAPSCARGAGDDGLNLVGLGCNVTDICAEGWHVCGSRQEVAARSPLNTCSGSIPAGAPSLFFATRETGNGNGSCADTVGINNDLFGCGNIGDNGPNANCSPLDRFSNNLCANLNSVVNVPWNCNTGANADVQEALRVTKTTSDRGGVLCCISPVTRIDARPANPTRINNAGFTFGGGTTYRCSLDGAAFAACPASYSPGTLTDGSHTVEVFAIDEFGNADLTTESYTWVIDTVPPETTIVDGPGAASGAFVSSTSATFDFSTVGGVSYQCSLDSAAFAACTDPVTFNGLSQGAHSLAVRAVDAAGNVDASPATYSWTVDTVAPTLTVSVPTPGQVFLPTVDVPVTSTTEAGVSLRIRILAPGPTEVYNEVTTGFGPTGTIDTDMLPQGTYTAEVTATDAAGNATTRTVSFVVDINECTTNNGGCDVLTTCTNSVGSFSCGACPSGFTGTGSTGCVDINECSTNNGGCDPLSACTNTPGSFSCGACPSGYTGTGATSCNDINECATNNGGCDALTACTNTPGSRTCGACPAGYTGTGATSCDDINECLTANGGCDALTACTNTAGSRTCGACPAGYTGDGVSGCDDINECLTANGGCDPLTACTNTPGSATCGACPAGYTGDGDSGCDDINECLTDNGGCDALTVCNNTPGSSSCGACPSGYAGTGATSCTDIDECLTDNGGCDPLTDCNNTPGGFTCGDCPTGYVDDGAGGCNDIDECATNNGGCDDLTVCTNTDGSRTCGACPTGYAGDGVNGCNDIDECLTDNGGCDALTLCTNTPGSSTCGACPAGYTGDGDVGCTDVDECLTDNGGCDTLTECTNTPGSSTCGACPAGYDGDGDLGCTDIDECLTDNGGCDALTLCTNIDGGRLCDACPDGYSGDGENGCVDIDECATDNGGCDVLTDCTNDDGGFTCGACPDGYTGDGDLGCTDIDECLVDNGGCDDLTFCTNTDGGFECGACPAGYADDGAGGCEDVDECADGGANNCDPLADCTNTDGGFECGACPEGYIGDGTLCEEDRTDAPPWVLFTAPLDGDVLLASPTEISGRTEPNLPVEVFINGELIGSTTSDAAGNWSLVLDAPLDPGTVALRAEATDNEGRVGRADITFEILPPDALTIDSPSDGDVLRTSRPTLTGRSPAGATVEIFVDGDSVGTVVADESGAWTWTSEVDLADGPVMFTAETSEGGVPQSVVIDVTIDTSTPGTITIDAPADGTLTRDPQPAITGLTDPGATVRIFDGETLLGETTADSNGRYTFTPTEDLTDGEHTLTARSGSAEDSVTITVDTLPPVLTVDTPVADSTTGPGTVTVVGTSEPGAFIELFANGVLVGSATADENGDWTADIAPELEDGPWTLEATATDEAGNQTVVSVDLIWDGETTGEDVGPDAGDDVGTDTGDDVGTDTDSDVGPDVTDSGADTGADAGSDTAADAATDVESDATIEEELSVDFRGGALLGCSATESGRSVPGGWMLMLAGVVLWMRRRR